METKAYTTIKEKVSAYLVKTSPTTSVIRKPGNRTQERYEENLTITFNEIIHFKKDYQMALGFIGIAFKLPRTIRFTAELFFLRSKCYLALGDYRNACRSVNSCVDFNGRDTTTTSERTELIRELREIALEGVKIQNLSLVKDCFTFS